MNGTTHDLQGRLLDIICVHVVSKSSWNTLYNKKKKHFSYQISISIYIYDYWN